MMNINTMVSDRKESIEEEIFLLKEKLSEIESLEESIEEVIQDAASEIADSRRDIVRSATSQIEDKFEDLEIEFDYSDLQETVEVDIDDAVTNY